MAGSSKQIIFEYEGKEYTLEFDRKQVERMERNGFKINEVGDKPMTSMPMLFEGAFQKHHRNINSETVNKILSSIKDRDSLFEKLLEMYADPIVTLFDEPEESEKNIEWDASW